MTRLSNMLVLGLFVAACGGTEEDPAPLGDDHESPPPQAEMRSSTAVSEPEHESASTQSSIEGIVRVVGADPSPQVVLEPSEGGAAEEVALVGELREELGRLSGVMVTLTGESVPNPQGIPAHAFDVGAYDVISVNSEAAYLGLLEQRNGEWWLDRDEPLLLVFVPAAMESHNGGKLWVAGQLDGNRMRVQSYGVVRVP